MFNDGTSRPTATDTLRGKNILITGAGGSGVGRGISDAILAAGGRPIFNDIDDDAADRLRERYPDQVVISGDASNEAIVERMFAQVRDEVGALHGLVNNAGVGLVKPFYSVAFEEQQRLFNVDLTATWLTAKAFTIQAMQHGIPGSIVNISSIHAHSTTSGYALYASCKGAVESLTRGIAVEVGAHRIRCNALAPGFVESEQNESLLAALTPDPTGWVRRHISDQQALPEPVTAIDCGNLSVYLLSDLSQGITGQTIRVDAGTTSLVYGKDFTDHSKHAGAL